MNSFLFGFLCGVLVAVIFELWFVIAATLKDVTTTDNQEDEHEQGV